jgi:poly(hydroxyalkanoate) granule-associated protein
MAARRNTKARKTTRTRRNGSQARTVQVKLVDAVNQIWLAGMGALSRAQKEGPRAFETMIVEGASLIDKSREQAEDKLREAIATVQSTVEDRMQGTKEQASETWDNLEKMFQGRVTKVLQQVGVPTAKEINALTRRVDELNMNVLALGKFQRAAAAKKPVPRRRKAPARAAA